MEGAHQNVGKRVAVLQGLEGPQGLARRVELNPASGSFAGDREQRRLKRGRPDKEDLVRSEQVPLLKAHGADLSNAIAVRRIVSNSAGTPRRDVHAALGTNRDPFPLVERPVPLPHRFHFRGNLISIDADFPRRRRDFPDVELVQDVLNEIMVPRVVMGIGHFRVPQGVLEDDREQRPGSGRYAGIR